MTDKGYKYLKSQEDINHQFLVHIKNMFMLNNCLCNLKITLQTKCSSL